MVIPYPGSLNRVLKRWGLTPAECAMCLCSSRKTLKKINLGLPVRDRTLGEVARALGVPTEQFFEQKTSNRFLPPGPTPIWQSPKIGATRIARSRGRTSEKLGSRDHRITAGEAVGLVALYLWYSDSFELK